LTDSFRFLDLRARGGWDDLDRERIQMVPPPGRKDFAGEAFLFDSSGNLLQTLGGSTGPSAFGFVVAISWDGSSIVVGGPFANVSGVTSEGQGFLFRSNV